MKTKYFSIASLGVGITLLCVLVGELFRFKGVLLLDIWAPIFAALWLITKLRDKKLKCMPKLLWPALAFIGIGLGSLLLNSAEMSWGAFLGSALYGVRWASLFLIGIFVMEEKPASKKILLAQVVILSVLLALGGFIQLAIAPDFTEYEILGWDPHQGRLLGTWFDPNLIGGWFAVISPVILGLAWDDKKYRWWWLIALAILGSAILLTLSRSAYLAIIVAFGFFSLVRSRALLTGLILLSLIATATLSPVQERVFSLIDSAQSVFTETYSLPDASARHRFGSWEEGWNLFLEKPLLGHGYNRYAEAALELGTLKDTEIHSASGSDSSLLTVLATTGILGFLPFLTIYALVLRWAWAQRKKSVSLGLASGILGLFIHSIFVNSLLFPLLMAPLWILIGSTLRSKSCP